MSADNVLYKIDDANAALVYTGDWVVGGAEGEWENTSHGALTAGSNCTFTFNGTFVAAYGTVDQSGLALTYSLDGGPPTSVVQAGAAPPQYGVPFFSSAQMPAGTHTLVVAAAGGGAAPRLWLDYLTYTGARLEGAPPSHEAAVVAPPATAAPAGMPRGTLVLVVVVSVLIFVVLVLLVAAGAVLFRRRHRLRLPRPAHDPAATGKGFDILEPEPERHLVDAIRFKLLGARRSPSRANPGAPTQPAQSSSTMFTSVIFAPSSVATTATRV